MPPIVNRRKCPAQKELCKVIAACPTAAISYVEDDKERLGGKIVIDDVLCNDCGICVQECCGQTIEMAPGWKFENHI
jgi:Pyruvate/2-oxoacid:ferredoxin oxidoreductase delta subunit